MALRPIPLLVVVTVIVFLSITVVYGLAFAVNLRGTHFGRVGQVFHLKFVILEKIRRYCLLTLLIGGKYYCQSRLGSVF